MGRVERRIGIISVMFLCLVSSWNVMSQSGYGGFTNYSRLDGMFHSSIQTVMQDSRGYVWIGSSDGLMRSDGVYFDTFSKKNTYSSLLSDNTINCILEDENEYVFWIGTSVGGINRFDITQRDSIHYYIKPDADNPRSMVQISALGQINPHMLLVGTNSQGLYYFNTKEKSFEKIEDAFKTSSEFPTSIIEIEKTENFIWVTSSNGLLQFSHSGEYLTTYYFNGESFTQNDKEKSLEINSIKEVDNDNIEFSYGNSLYSYNWQTNELKLLFQSTFKDVVLKCFEKDYKGGYWIGTENDGLIYYSEVDSSTTLFTTDNKQTSIESNVVKDMIMSQNQSILWVATPNGLSKYDYYKSKFLQFDIDALSNKKLSSVFTLFKDAENGYWIRGKNDTYYKSKTDSVFLKVNWLNDRIIYQVKQDLDSNIWLTSRTGLFRYDLKSKKHKRISFNDKNCDISKLNYITALNIVSNDILWCISESGLIKYNIKTSQYKVFPWKENLSKTNRRFTDIELSTDENILWISSRSGDLISFNIHNSVYEYRDMKEVLGNVNRPCIITDIELVGKDEIWMATYGNGLLIYNMESKSISTDLSYGFMESYVYAVVNDGVGNIWMSTNQGICRVSQKDRSVKFYDQTDGTFCTEFNELSYCKSSDGHILFGGLKGFIEFDPQNIHKNLYKPKVYISSYMEGIKSAVYGEELMDDVRYSTDSLITVKGDSEVKFYASVINYSISIDNRIKWKLEGFDKEWKDGYSYEAMSYNNLKKGTFVLRVKGFTNDGIESENEAKLKIKVKAKFIDTTFFQIVLVLVIVGAVLLLIRTRVVWHQTQNRLLVSKVNKKTEEITNANRELEESKNKILNQKTELEIHRNYLEELVELRTADLEAAKIKAEESDKLKTSFLANLSHEVRTPMNAIVGFSNLLVSDEFEVAQQRHFLNLINQSSESLLALINDIIDISRIETGNIELINQKTNIPQLVKEIKEELVFEMKSKEVRFMQYYELNCEDMDICIDRFRLKQIVSNLLRNAFKFTSEGYVKLTVKSVNKDELPAMGFSLNGKASTDFVPIVFMVEDTGIGIKEKDLKVIFEPFQKAPTTSKIYDGMGLGLSIVRNLVDLFGGDIIVKSEYQKGTKFYFFINKCLYHC